MNYCGSLTNARSSGAQTRTNKPRCATIRNCHKYSSADNVNLNYCGFAYARSSGARARTNKARCANMKSCHKYWGAESVNVDFAGPLTNAVTSGVRARTNKPRCASIKKMPQIAGCGERQY